MGNFKEEIVKKCKAASACEHEFEKLLAAKTKQKIWEVLLSNYNWCKVNNIFYERPAKFKFPKSFRGSLDLSGCDIKGITLPRSVGGSLYLSGCDLKGITLPRSVGGSLYLSGCDLKGITLPTSVGGSLDLSGCDIKGITLPTSVGGSLYLSG
jgi:uncharacterized protein YjbI with pentapeptide repeats